MAISGIKTDCDCSDVPSWEVNSVQEMGRDLESHPPEGTIQLGCNAAIGLFERFVSLLPIHTHVAAPPQVVTSPVQAGTLPNAKC